MPSFARKKVLERDRGVCVQCGVEAQGRDNQIARELQKERRLRRGTLTRVVLRDHLKQHLLDILPRYGLSDPGEMGWQMDHIIAVEQGGGECGLENLQTLCTVCHRQKSKQQAAERAQRRKAVRSQGISLSGEMP
ncbi:hypothetical protein GCM10008938_48830 [Deinococcus roseus]|uniref:HNH domain-containing protein n=2 Tax=Deinococcus roseus TaxID=392414 RepID=A0ABQ2DG70_9DEIO|nr:hypothetical protein GCM10008938_48830 [Deinococcus roseus]